MANQITGKILRIYPTETITRKSGKSIDKRSIVIDCTRFDPYTGERGFENTPQLEFVGDRCRELDSYQPGQIVTITFDVNGSRYTTADGREQIFTRVQPYRIEAKQVQHHAPQQAQQPQPQYQQPAQQVQQPQYQQGYHQDFPPRTDTNGQPLPF